MKRPIESSKAKDWAFFSVEPPEGTLEPDQRINVRVIFTPVLGREAPYLQVCEGYWAGRHRTCRCVRGTGRGGTVPAGVRA